MRCSKRLILAFFLLLATGAVSAQQLSLGNTPSVLTKSAVLELNSAKQGLLLPRLADTTAINALNPPDGMIIYFTPTKQIFIRANGYWNPLAFSTSLNNYWNVDGNSNGAVKKLGTADNYDLPFITNNTERMRLTTAGRLGIGITNPSALLHVAGTNPLTLQGVQAGGTTTADSVLTINNGTVQKLPVATFQPMLNGTGFVKASGTTVSYDNNTYTVANSPITASTKTKITYDAKGLVISGANLAAGDIPDLSGTYQPLNGSLTSISGLAGTVGYLRKTAANTYVLDNSTFLTTETDPVVKAINGIVKSNGTTISAAAAGTDYVAPNTAITGATKTKITYDAKGLVTAGADATTSDIAEGSNLYYTDARVRAAALTGLSTATATAVTAGDNVLGGVGKLQAQINTINGAGYLTAESDPLAAKKANNLSDLANVGTARTNLGATTVGSNFFTLTNPSAVTFPRINADNSVSTLDAATFRAAIGAGTGGGTVTSASVVTANGFAGSVATSTTTPAITLSTTVTGLLKGNGTAISAATAGTDYQAAIALPYATNRYWNGYGNFVGLNTDSVTQGSTNLFATAAEKSAWNAKESAIVAPYATNRYWNGYKQFVALNTDSITQGSTNLFFTEARVRSTVLTGLSTGTATAVTASDNILAGVGKLQAQINNINGAGYLTGNQSITLSGDVSGSGTTAITTTIGANKVTLGQMAQVGTGTFLGRTTAGTGNVEALTTAQAKTLLGLGGSNSGDVSLAGQNYLSLSGQTITANAVDLSGTHATGTLAAARFGALTGDVTNAAGSYATTIANGAVTYGKMQNVSATNRLLGRYSAGAGSPEEIIIGSGLALTGNTLSATAATNWNMNGNAGITASQFLGTTDDKALILKSNNATYFELGRRQTLGLTQSYADYNDDNEQVMHLRSALQFYAPAASFYKPKMYVDVNGNFRVKGSSAGTDFFEFGSTGTNNNGGFEFIIGDDGDEPILFKSYHYQNGMSEIMRLQSGRMAVGSNSFNATNPEKLLIDAGNTTSYNLMTGKGSIDNYLQINVQNRSATANASSDLVATADNGDESVNYIDMGINSSVYSNASFPVIGGANNAYLYTTGNDFIIGNGTAAKPLRFFTGGFANSNERLRIAGDGKVGIGTTSPSEALDVTGNLKFSAALMPGGSAGTAGYLLQSNGAGTAPSWINGGSLLSGSAWMLDGNTLTAEKKFGTASNHALPFITNNAERMRLGTNGFLGLGTNSAAGRFHAVSEGSESGDDYIFDDYTSTTNPGFFFRRSRGTVAVPANLQSGDLINALRFVPRFNGSLAYAPGSALEAYYTGSGTDNKSDLRLFTSGTEQVRIDEDGNVGIGTTAFDATSPEKLLVDAGTGTYTPILAKGSYDGYFQINIKNSSTGTQSSSDLVATANNGTETTNFVNLGINGSGFMYQAGNPIETGKANDGYLLSAGSDFYLVNNNAAKDMIFMTGGTAPANEAMRITSAEKVGIGTTAPVEKFHVVNTTTAGNTLTPVATVESNNSTASALSMPPALQMVRQVPSFSNGTPYQGPGLSFGFRTSGTVNPVAQLISQAGMTSSRVSFWTRTGTTNGNPATGTLAENMYIEGTALNVKNLQGGTSNIGVDANGNIIRTASDGRLKRDVRTLENPLGKIMALRGVSYNWIDTARMGSQREIGFIAQELEKVVPEVVSSGGEYKSVNYPLLTALLTEAMKEQQKEIDGLKKETKDLRQELDALREEVRGLLKAAKSR